MRPDSEQDRCLAALVTIQPDPERAAETLRRCRTVIERRVPAGGSPAGVRTGRRAPTASNATIRNALAGACCVLCVVYVLALALTTVGLHSMSR
jgi:hypothetical protein